MWREHDSGTTATNGIGGDTQVGTGWCKRYVRDDFPESLVTVAVYPIGVSLPGEGGHEIDNTSLELEQRVEFSICTDPGNPTRTVIWSDCECDSPLADLDGTDLHLKDVDHAGQEAKRLLEAVWVPELISWNGVTRER